MGKRGFNWIMAGLPGPLSIAITVAITALTALSSNDEKEKTTSKDK
jgi:hypothetical protein